MTTRGSLALLALLSFVLVASSAARAEPIRFVAIGDTGKITVGLSEVVASIAAKCKRDGCDFVQLLGDNIYNSGVTSIDDPQWQEKFEAPFAPIDLPFYAVLGNHDYGGRGAGNHFELGQFQVDYSKVSKKWHMPGKHWRRRVGNVEFFALDTNMMVYDKADAQIRDLRKWIGASKTKWKIALGHHPYKSNGPHGDAGAFERRPEVKRVNGHRMKTFMDEDVCGKVDLFIAGHDHSRQWISNGCGTTELAVTGASSTTTQVTWGTNEARFQSDQLGFLYIVIDGDVLTAEFLDRHGNVDFKHTMTKTRAR